MTVPAAKDVPGPPTREELLANYPAKFTWEQLKTFVNSGDLGLLKRDRTLQKRYDLWAVGIKEKYGGIVNYLLQHRLQWGKPDSLSRLSSALDDKAFPFDGTVQSNGAASPPLFFTASTPLEYLSVIQNDWPYSVPAEVEHTLIWTKVPIYHSNISHPSISKRLEQDGLWGFTGSTSPPPSPSTLHLCLPALAEWGITKDKMIVSPKASPGEEELVRKAGEHVREFVERRWTEDEWETAWFVNPPRLQSVPGLAHIHVFAKKKN
ncbi:hypothetical protein K435DRAFT_827275 [Dendrothele bispora CBS 962.96]|uniref:Uncharacterized protein n=1 Tax=Dendrothele bispora (strain CBS 962.96) TaxID=1314807 RepID=A0A4S8MLH1_DENBC|nr:hypothetical protein K435DRAFT_827275 [Dendrothele bispora CBS 962.96]